MKVGDLVRCTWQPKTAIVEKDDLVPLKHKLKGELGIITEVRKLVSGGSHWLITFPQCRHTHTLSRRAFEVISESR